MKLVVTAMVRDEADIIRQWLDYHIAQGVDTIIVTDNGSVDGTREILQEYADKGAVDLRDDPEQKKQQGRVVTIMARDAYTIHGADWVVNADADEFLMPVDRSRSLADVFAALDPALSSFTVPVVNMVGAVADHGAGLERLVWRDGRDNEELKWRGVLAQPTPNAVHVGSPDVTVVQGNHLVSIASHGSPGAAEALEVLHLPWRSWTQLRNKVEISGRAYEASPELNPSPNHHGMLDYRRYHEGTLFYYYAARMITETDAADGPFVEDRSLPEFFEKHGFDLAAYPQDATLDAAEAAVAITIGAALSGRDRTITLEKDGRYLEGEAAKARILELERTIHALDETRQRLDDELARTHARKVVRVADAAGLAARRLRSRSRM